MSAIRLTDLTLGYDRHPAVHHLSGEIATGSLTAIVGPNGAGKSTLLKGIAGALSPLDGDIALARGRRLAYLPQQAELDRSFPIHVYDLVAMGLWNRAGIFGRIGGGAAAKIEAAIAAVGLAGFERRPIGALSGGQMQRALFARLLLQDADIILLDEPFTAIDARTTADLLALVQRWHGESRTVVAVLHDIETVRRAFPQTLLLARESVAWGATADVLTPANLLKARRMVEAFDSHAAPCERDAA
ncbi:MULTISPECIES: zinc ABC transporter ATP-binding protein AztA [unclassified Bosea (in: a-proteobacteria)]|jgi:zinc/manganese transport system ATP-binding protein|uniref:zinc ABC transporter ATP-binding protein AztA n=1 Tax=unclassified Bosea (in: a-proteobacteria) TaxID=2653178 RepID=UPI00083E5A98|nr:MULTISPECIES: zinc ABC transporter ATP-binding protein AztA [unclassified Bosea (in: a-proteobacteria)]AOG06820.1 ABC transporter family protein [Bosea sp. RAC05]MCZ8044491.1 zinc ABC transporter ATP-binding protein AztA [Beijerinckiaceae bacterium]